LQLQDNNFKHLSSHLTEPITNMSSTQTQHHSGSISVVSEAPAPSGPVSSEITFFQDPEDGSKPFNYVMTAPEGQPQRNYGENKATVQISDLRGKEGDFSLNTSGFATLKGVPSTLAYTDWENDTAIEQSYYPEVEKLLLGSAPGSQRVFIFDHTVRRTRPDAHRSPVTRAHIDQTLKSATQRVRNHMGADAEELLQGRVRLINVWRPLKGPVKAFPLAMADSRSVKDEDLVPVEHRYPHMTGETAGVRNAEGQQWYYWSGMSTDERILLQCFDSQGSKARVAHTAFVDPRSAEGEGRESIEVRALVFG
jgi:hypothetical protein